MIYSFRKLAAGDLAGRDEDDGLLQLAKLCSIDVGEIGVGGAKNFFEAKIKTYLGSKIVLRPRHIPGFNQSSLDYQYQ